MAKNSIYILFISLLPFFLKAQTAFVVYNDGLTCGLDAGITATILGGYTSQTNGVDGSMDNNSIIQLTGNWANNNSGLSNAFADITAGTIKLIGTTQQIVSGAATTSFFNLEVNNTVATGGITVSKIIDISNALTLRDGVVATTAASPVVMNAGSSSSSGSDASHVDGPMLKIGTTAFTFPLGNLGVWARIEIGAPTSVTTFQAQYHCAKSVSSTSLAATPSPALNNVSSVEYWGLSRFSGSGNATVILHWESAARSGITSCADLKLARWNGAAWENTYNATSVSSGTCSGFSAGTVSSGVAVTAFVGSFTFGSITAGSVNYLPVELLSFDAKLNNEVVDLFWETATEINNDYFTIEKSKDGILFKEILFVEGAGNSNQRIEYLDIDYTPWYGITYYRLKQTDFDGRYTYSNIVPVDNKKKGDITPSGLFIYPNPSTGDNVNLELTGYDAEKEVLVILRDITGKEHYSKIVITDINGRFVSAIDLQHKLAAGTYVITGASQNSLYSKKLLVK